MIRASSRNSNWLSALKWGPIFVALAGALLLGACKVSSEELEFQRAEEAAQKNDYAVAVQHYKAIADRYVKTPLAIKSAKEAARITHYQLKQPKEAVNFYRHVILYSPVASDRVEAEKKLADLYFSQLMDYTDSISEFNRLLELPHKPDDDFNYHLSIARSYFYLSNFYQAQIEIEGIMKKNYDKTLLFDALLLKANIFLTNKDLDQAISTLKQLMTDYPERSKTETIGLVLAVTYEEQKNFAKAIETLESIKDIYPKRAFIEERIKTLRERQSYLPGAKGLKK